MDKNEGLAFMRGYEAGREDGYKQGKAEGFECGQREVRLIIRGPDVSNLPYLLSPESEMILTMPPYTYLIRIQTPEERRT